jgi:hypothetical protein
MQYLNKKLQNIPYVVHHLTDEISSDKSPFELLNEAPWFVRLLSCGQYCVYKKTIYVPMFHLELVKSLNFDDRTLATAKLLPLIMMLHDYESVSLFTMMQLLYSLKYQLHYFLYQFLFLKAAENRFYETVTTGFLTTRKHWFKKLSPDVVEEYLKTILITNPTKYP